MRVRAKGARPPSSDPSGSYSKSGEDKRGRQERVRLPGVVKQFPSLRALPTPSQGPLKGERRRPVGALHNHCERVCANAPLNRAHCSTQTEASKELWSALTATRRRPQPPPGGAPKRRGCRCSTAWCEEWAKRANTRCVQRKHTRARTRIQLIRSDGDTYASTYNLRTLSDKQSCNNNTNKANETNKNKKTIYQNTHKNK